MPCVWKEGSLQCSEVGFVKREVRQVVSIFETSPPWCDFFENQGCSNTMLRRSASRKFDRVVSRRLVNTKQAGGCFEYSLKPVRG